MSDRRPSGAAAFGLPALSAVRLLGAVAVEFAIIWRFGVGSQTDLYFMTVAFPWLASRAVAAAAPVALVPSLRSARDRQSPSLRGLALLAFLVALVICAGIATALLIGARFTPIRLASGLALTLVAAHSIASASEVLKTYLIAGDAAERALVSDAVQALVAVVGVGLLASDAPIHAVGAVVLASFMMQQLVLVLFAAHLPGASGGKRLRFAELWSATKRSFLLTIGATASRRLTVPLERQFGSLSGAGHATAVAYAGQMTNAMAGVLGIFTTNSLLPFLSGQRTTEERKTVLVAYVVWLAEIGAVAAITTATLSLWMLLFEPAVATESFRPLIIAGAITILALPGMLVVQALLSAHYARGDGATPTRHLLITLAVHIACLLAVRGDWGVAGIAACWLVTGTYSVVRAIRVTRPLFNGELFSSFDFRVLATRTSVVMMVSVAATALGGTLADWRGAGVAALGVAVAFAVTRGRAGGSLVRLRTKGAGE